MNGSFLFIVRGTTALGGFLGAGLAAAFGVRPTIIITTAGVLIGTAWLLIPSMARLREPLEPTDTTPE